MTSENDISKSRQLLSERIRQTLKELKKQENSILYGIAYCVMEEKFHQIPALKSKLDEIDRRYQAHNKSLLRTKREELKKIMKKRLT